MEALPVLHLSIPHSAIHQIRKPVHSSVRQVSYMVSPKDCVNIGLRITYQRLFALSWKLTSWELYDSV